MRESSSSTKGSLEDAPTTDGSLGTNTNAVTDLRPRPLRDLRDDSTRAKRMMGDLLGTLQGGRASKRSNSNSNELSKSEIEQRIRNRRAAINSQGAQESQALKETIIRKRRERKKLEMTKRHERMRKDARFLQTRTKPMLTFLPRVLTQEDSALINEQCKGVEYDIQRELAEQRDAMA